jgi:hypothetical protein
VLRYVGFVIKVKLGHRVALSVFLRNSVFLGREIISKRKNRQEMSDYAGRARRFYVVRFPRLLHITSTYEHVDTANILYHITRADFLNVYYPKSCIFLRFWGIRHMFLHLEISIFPAAKWLDKLLLCIAIETGWTVLGIQCHGSGISGHYDRQLSSWENCYRSVRRNCTENGEELHHSRY